MMQLVRKKYTQNFQDKNADILYGYAESLQKNPSPEIRVIIADTVSKYLKDKIFGQTEEALAYEIIRLLARDVNTQVRKSLAENFKNSEALPRDIAIILAGDIPQISVPVLEYSNIFTDSDLLNIIRNTKFTEKFVVISKRQNLTKNIINELLATKNEEVIINLLFRKNIDYSQIQNEFILNLFKNNSNAAATLISSGLPIILIEKFLNRVSPESCSSFINQYNVYKENAPQLIKSVKIRLSH